MLGEHVLGGYLPILIVIVIALLLGSGMLWLNHLLGQVPTELTKKKFDTYECGVPYVGSGHQQFSVRYYLVGIIFLVFDVEVVFMYPWALVYKKLVAASPVIIYEMLFFLVVLLIGYVYLRLCGALKWD